MVDREQIDSNHYYELRNEDNGGDGPRGWTSSRRRAAENAGIDDTARKTGAAAPRLKHTSVWWGSSIAWGHITVSWDCKELWS